MKAATVSGVTYRLWLWVCTAVHDIVIAKLCIVHRRIEHVGVCCRQMTSRYVNMHVYFRLLLLQWWGWWWWWWRYWFICAGCHTSLHNTQYCTLLRALTIHQLITHTYTHIQVFTVRLCEAYTHGIAVEILSVRSSVRLSNACIVTKRQHLAKKVQLRLIEVAYELSNEPKMNIVRCP